MVGDSSVQVTFHNFFAFTVWGWDGLGREVSHTLIPSLSAAVSANWWRVHKMLPLSSGVNQWNRFRNSFAPLQFLLLCQWCRDNPHTLTGSTAAKRCREVTYLFIRYLGTEQELALNWEQKSSFFLGFFLKIDGKHLRRESLDLNKLQLWSYIYLFLCLVL